MSLLDQGIFEIAKKVRSGEVSAKTVATEALARAKNKNKELNAFITLTDDQALEQAEKVDRMVSQKRDPGLLAGVPVGIKDILLTKGVRTTAGSKILENFVPPYSSTVVEKLEAAGAITIGKTNLDEFAMGASNENSAFGPVKNPWDTSRVPGGSSGGSAAAVAARLVPGAIGTDTGGSIREPAAFCGLTGIKPTYGRVSRYGVVAFASSLDQVGPMTHSVQDAALMLQAISGKDPKDSTTAVQAVPDFSKALVKNVKGFKVGLPKEYFADGIEPEVRAAVDNAIAVLKSQGAEIVPLSLPLTSHGIAVYYLIAPCEASSNLARYDGVKYGHRSKDSKDLMDLYCRSRGEGFGAEPKRRIMLGTFALSSGYYDAYYKKACQVRRLLRDDFVKAFKQVDVIAAPVATGPAFKLGEKADDPLAMYLNDIFTLPPSLAGIPALSVNCGFTKSGLPIGFQLMAKHWDEEKIIQAAFTVEQNLGLAPRRPHGF
ncbi:MAG: Asp-tRNA(Asn)/Glu-tRNA(Gln) amidotransferase subunit GatA [Oligoflexia bacterium]|nr:Asp-tRNA(Asn)/Glu-tRNA(Gln) amidotransferase subunit GatA [Oligoflexia bacterium]